MNRPALSLAQFRVLEDQYMREAFRNTFGHPNRAIDGTYEFLGPKSQGNVEEIGTHCLWAHGAIKFAYDEVPRTFDGLREFFARRAGMGVENGEMEGIVWHHKDGRMVKIKAKDFGFKRGKKPVAS